MAKIRVYELARNLNMKNKDLLEKLSDMDISVKSHMSTLDEETVVKVRSNLAGTKVDTVEVTRVKPTVIRRRKKVISKEPVQVVDDFKPAEAEETDRSEKVEIDKHPSEQIVEEKKPSPQKERVEEKKPDVIKIKDAAEPMASKEAVPNLEPTEVVAPETEVVAPEVDEPVKKNLQTPPLKKIKKKEKKETPAKIIKIGPAIAPEKVRVEKKAPAIKPKAKLKKVPEPEKPVEDVKETIPAKRKKQRALKGTPEGETKDKKFFKKKISFRKKEVVEGKDLYAREDRTRRGKKSAKGKIPVQKQKTQITTAKAIKRRIKVDDAIALSDLAKRMGIKANEIIMKLMNLGVMATVNQIIDFDTAALVATEFDYELEKASFEEEVILTEEQDDPDKRIVRPPVVTIMGHVDHGKTSLLDVIRQTSVSAIEAGGITQHIGAYHVRTDKGQIVFLDTPGHEAFTAMRSRGAMVTDIVVLVVAADDGVMPQTTEAINHAKAAKVPIIVAVNKIDKANAHIENVQRELAEAGLTPEDWGGDTIFVMVSAKMHQGIDDLLEMIILQAELMELSANPDKLAKGYVVEAKLDSGRGPVATVLVHEGTLHAGDPVVCGMHYGKVRALLDDKRNKLEAAGPSIPVEVIGLSGVPNAGDMLIALSDEKDAKQVSSHRIQQQRFKELAKTSKLNLEDFLEHMQENEVKELNLIIKADVHGSIEALKDSLTKLSNDEVAINIIHSATGTINESDVSLASVSDATVIGFNVRPNLKVQALASEINVDILYYNVIYNTIKDIKKAIVGMMPSAYEEKVLGHAVVREVFHVPKVGTVAGCYVDEGKIQRGQLVRLIRDGIVNYEGKLASLKRFKDDAKEVLSGYECGIGIENYNDIKVGDTIECYYIEEIRPELED